MAVFQRSFSDYYSEPRTDWDPAPGQSTIHLEAATLHLVAELLMNVTHNGPIARPAHE